MLKALSVFWARPSGYIFYLLYGSRGNYGVKNFFKSLLHYFVPGKDAVFKLRFNPDH